MGLTRTPQGRGAVTAVSREVSVQMTIRKLCRNPKDIAVMPRTCRHVIEAMCKGMTAVVTCSVVTCGVVRCKRHSYPSKP